MDGNPASNLCELTCVHELIVFGRPELTFGFKSVQHSKAIAVPRVQFRERQSQVVVLLRFFWQNLRPERVAKTERDHFLHHENVLKSPQVI